MSACGQLVDEVLRRVRDPQGTANSRALVRDLLDRAQVLFVRATGTLIVDTTVSLTPERLVYDLDAQTALRIVDIFVDDRRLWPIRWIQMDAQRGPQWWRGVSATGPRVWAPLGTTHFVIYPAPSSALGTISASVRIQQRPDTLDSDAVDMQLPNEFYPRLLDFVEAAVLLRQRDPALPQALERVEGAVETAEDQVA